MGKGSTLNQKVKSLHLAAPNSTDMFSISVAKQNPDDSTPTGDFPSNREALEKCIRYHREFEDRTQLRRVSKRGQLDLVRYLVEYKNVDIEPELCVSLCMAASDGHLRVVKYFVERGARVDCENNWALRHASLHGHVDVVKYLVERGADIHVENDWCILFGCELGRFSVVEYFISKGVAIQGRMDIFSSAIRCGCLELVRLLVENGVLNGTESGGMREAMTEAVSNGHVHIVKYFEQLGHQVGVKDVTLWEWRLFNMFSGCNAILYALRRHNRKDIVFARSLLVEDVWKRWDTRMLMVVNLVKGTIRYGDHKSHLGCEDWGASEYYDPNLGMLICSYVD